MSRNIVVYCFVQKTSYKWYLSHLYSCFLLRVSFDSSAQPTFNSFPFTIAPERSENDMLANWCESNSMKQYPAEVVSTPGDCTSCNSIYTGMRTHTYMQLGLQKLVQFFAHLISCDSTINVTHEKCAFVLCRFCATQTIANLHPKNTHRRDEGLLTSILFREVNKAVSRWERTPLPTSLTQEPAAES